MATKKSVRKFFIKKPKMADEQTLDHENLPEQPTDQVEETQPEVVESVEEAQPEPESTPEPEQPETEDEVKSTSPCPECNGTGLASSEALCSNCAGSGQL